MKRPAFQFYPGDWLRDTALRMCSVGARGLWIDMICLMHDGEPYGHLKVNDKEITLDILARLVGANKGEVEEWINELEDTGVLSRDRSGIIFCRRMVRDEELRKERVKGGKAGGNPKLIGEYNKPGFIYIAERKSDSNIKIGISCNPSKRLYKIRQQFPGDQIEIIDKAYVSDMGNIESQLRKIFEQKSDGEWFNLNNQERDHLFSLMVHLKENDKVNIKEILTPAFASAFAFIKENTNTPPISPQGGSESVYSAFDSQDGKNIVGNSTEELEITELDASKRKATRRGRKRKCEEFILPASLQPFFDEFWTEYVRKVSKDDAKRAMADLNPDKQLQGKILAGVRRAKIRDPAWIKKDFEHIKLPAGWIRGRRWEDEYPEQGNEFEGRTIDDWLHDMEEKAKNEK